MINGNIDYDFDEVIIYIRTHGKTPVENLATQINKIGNDLTDMQANFHAQKLDSAVGKIYKGFSDIIGDKSNGLIKLNLAAANIINICYNEAMRDKRILENFSDGESINNEEVSEPSTNSNSTSNVTSQNTPSSSGMPQFGPDGLLIKEKSQAGQDVINRLFKEIPSHANGTHSEQLDQMIDNLSAEECVWVLSRIENEGFGQTGAGYSKATPESHQNFIDQQINGRFDGDIHNLLKKWGTFPYSGY